MNFLRMHLSFTEARRRRLAKKADRLDRLESRTTITEPISFTGMAVSAMGSLVRLGFIYPDTGNACAEPCACQGGWQAGGAVEPQAVCNPGEPAQIDRRDRHEPLGGWWLRGGGLTRGFDSPARRRRFLE